MSVSTVNTSRTWRFRLARTFFGLTDEYMENVYETFFFMKYSGGWSFAEAYNLPVGLRTWFAKRLVTQLKIEQDAVEKANKGSGGTSTQTLSAHNQPNLPQRYQNK